MTLPNFVVIGAAKSGTSSLYAYLEGHPDIFMSRVKELQYFCGEFAPELGLDSTWARGQEWYEAQFADAGTALTLGEASTHYTLHPWSAGTAARMAEVIPHAKLVYVMRNPVDRALSHYLHWVREGNESQSVVEALRDRAIYLDTSRYAAQIEEFLNYFPREQLLLLTTEELGSDRSATLRRAFEFLGVDPGWVPDSLTREFNRASDQRRPRRALEVARRVPGRQVFARALPRSIVTTTKRRFLTTPVVDPKVAEVSDAERTEIGERLGEDVVRLRRYLGEDFHCWGLA